MITKTNLLEALFLQIYIKDDMVFRHYAENLPAIAFSDDILRKIFETTKSLFKKLNAAPTFNSFMLEYYELYKHESDNQFIEIHDIAEKLFHNTEKKDQKYIEDKFIDRAKKRLQRIIGTQIADNSIDAATAQNALIDLENLDNREIEKSSFKQRMINWAKILSADGRKRIPTGFVTLDRALQGGMPPGEYSILLGFTNSGKSFIANNIALNAIRFGFKVVHFTNENPIQEVMNRYAVGLAETPIHKLVEKASEYYDTVEPFEAIIHVVQAEVQKRLPAFDLDEHLHIFDLRDTQPTVHSMRNHLDRLHKFHDFKPDLIILDDLDNMEGSTLPTGRDNEEQRLTYTSKALNELADNLDVVLWVVGQMKGMDNVTLGKGESRSRRAKAEIPDNSFYNVQSEEDKLPGGGEKPRSRLIHKRARNMQIIEHPISLTHDYTNCRIYDSDIIFQQEQIDSALF